MPIPQNGIFRIYPRTITNFTTAGNYAMTAVGAPPPLATQIQIETYLNARVNDPANASRLRPIDLVLGEYVPAPGTYELEFTPDTTTIDFYTQGDVFVQQVDFLSAAFPVGFICQTLEVRLSGTLRYLGRDRQITNAKLKFSGSTVLDFTPVTDYAGYFLTSPQFAIIPFDGPFLGPLQVFKRFGFETTVINLVAAIFNTTGLRIDLFELFGTYHLWSTTITLDTPEGGPGSEISISDAVAQNLDTITGISLYDIDDDGILTTDPIIVPTGNFIRKTKTNLRFIFPSYVLSKRKVYRRMPFGGKKVIIMATGTQFSGEVPLGILNAVLVDGSGLYRLTPGKLNDTYYDRSVNPVDTVDLKIPDPFATTGFL